MAPAEASASDGVDRAIGLDLDHEVVVVGRLLDTGRLDVEADAADRAEDRVDGNHTDRAGLDLALAGGVATPLLDGEVDRQTGLAVERRDREVLVEDLDVGRALDVTSGDGGRATCVEAQVDRLVGGRGEHDVLDVQDDVGDILDDTRDGVELVKGFVEPHGRDRRAGNRRQEGATQRVAERVAEAGLERTDREALLVVALLADCFDGRALHDEHVLPGPF